MRNLSLFSRMILLQAAMILLPAFAGAANLQLNNGTTGITVKENNAFRLHLACSVASMGFTDIATPSGQFSMPAIDGFGRRNVAGAPALPVYRKLIDVPVGATFKVRILNQHIQEVSLRDAGIMSRIFPAQPPLSKGDDPNKVPFVYDRETYETAGWIADQLTTVTYVGTLRSLNLARVDISPVQYNPVEQKLRIYDELEIEIVFENADLPATQELKSSKASPYFNSLSGMVLNYSPSNMEKGLITTAPVTYVIVSDPMFQTTLQPFIEWKKKKGFKVIEGYTNNPSVGTTTTSIKAYLQGLYNTPPAGYNAPSFVLLVGDVAQIPAWAGGAGSH
jgi:gingipain K